MPNYPSFKTIPSSSADWRLDLWNNDYTEEYDVVGIDGKKRHVVREPYKSKWRRRKEARNANKDDLENGKETPATTMMMKRNITGKKAEYTNPVEEIPPKPEHKDSVHQSLVLKNGRWLVNKYTPYECKSIYPDVFYGPERVVDNDKVVRDLGRGWLKNAVPGETFEAYLDTIGYPKL
jgi:hypothetical protein